MNVYTVYCNSGRYDLNALVKARTATSAKNKVKRALPTLSFFGVHYKVKSARIATPQFLEEMELTRVVSIMGTKRVHVYDEGT